MSNKYGGSRILGTFKHLNISIPSVTIITVVFNGEKYLEETILHIINQTYHNFEYIIIDGGSTDGTLNIIKKYENHISYWISEPDKGISDAFNKGIQYALGDFINFQGDGDGFYAKDSLEKMMKGISSNDSIICGRIQRIGLNNESLYISPYIPHFRKQSLLLRMSLPHQGVFVHKKLFDQYGLFDIKNKYCMDYEHLLRMYHHFPKVITKDVIVARWRADGLGNGKIVEILKEYNRIKKKNKVANYFVLFFLNIWTFFKYYLALVIYRGKYK